VLEKLKQQFLITDDLIKVNLEQLLTKALPFCAVDPKGRVHLKSTTLGSKNKIRLVLVARKLASELDSKFPATLSITDLVDSTGLSENQVRARTSELVRERFAESPSRGEFRASPHKIEPFLDQIARDVHA
jgi:hypothetical protein